MRRLILKLNLQHPICYIMRGHVIDYCYGNFQKHGPTSEGNLPFAFLLCEYLDPFLVEHSAS